MRAGKGIAMTFTHVRSPLFGALRVCGVCLALVFCARAAIGQERVASRFLWSELAPETLASTSSGRARSPFDGIAPALDPSAARASAPIALDFTPVAEPELGSSACAQTTRGMEFSQDVVVRGSVNLPSIRAIQFWGNAYSGSGRVDPYGDEGGRIASNNTGASVGLTLPLGLATISGFYNYHRDREFLPGGRMEQKDNSYGMAAYMNLGGFYFAASGFYGDDKYRGRGVATVDASGAATRLSPSFGGSQSTGYFETGYEMMSLGMFVLKPFGSYHYSNVRHGKFDAGNFATVAGKQKYNSCRMTLGSRIDLNLAGLDVFTMQARMAWITELRSKAESFTSFCYGRVPGTVTPASPYYVGSGAGKDAFWGGVGLRLSLMGTFSLAVDYDTIYSKRHTLHEGSFGLLFGF